MNKAVGELASSTSVEQIDWLSIRQRLNYAVFLVQPHFAMENS